jgi:hypothetical protein
MRVLHFKKFLLLEYGDAFFMKAAKRIIIRDSEIVPSRQSSGITPPNDLKSTNHDLKIACAI